ncbi:tripartite tricarboxylate transporter substrate binding protein [Cupriavidus sp. SZY C1]|uniref:Bug family tripartite tricarboxylate transporter substrate binding protein n=1 Tax=Cupriavidus sp. SZY C1 TaxID=3055037 RepID=UPI0028BC2D77|nr:tripartite tricarboxylate transporter substrate binding protein [Cupriavidus sp. SZY C1]MDT6961395.1 tripartite tricarboxylate transporter substrate binding protein [Cupriavidus sp. SZY C1]
MNRCVRRPAIGWRLWMAVPAVVSVLAALPRPASAQPDDYPSRPVRVVVPFAAGGVADALPRLIGQKLSERWGKPVVIDNKPGAAGNIGMEAVARAAPDGYTLGLAPAGNLTVNPILFRKLSFETRDFVPVTMLAASPNVLVVNPSVPARSLKELVAYARTHPGELNFASPGNGSGAHLAGELLNLEAGVKTVHVPYNGMAPALNDVLAGQVQMMFGGISTVLQHIRTGKLVPLAVAGPRRLPQLPNVPTVAESGYPGFDVTSWYGLVAPKGTPEAVVRKWQADVATVLRDPDVRQKLDGLGLEPVGNTSQAFGDTIATETTKWRAIVHRANIPPLQ